MLISLPNFDLVACQLPAAPFGVMGLANPFLGFIGVARIRTVIGIHQVVPATTSRDWRWPIAKVARELCRATLGTNCRSAPVPFIS
jgi:hypothetical protein